MAKVPGFAKAFAGRWRIVEMDKWDSDFLDLVEEALLTFKGKSDGEIAFGALKGADSDDLARVYRFDLAQDSEMISPTIPI